MSEENTNAPKPSFWSIVFSTLAAAFGVQSSKNRERDFQHGNIWIFIVAGLIFTAIFVLSVVGLVQWVISS